MMSKDNKRVLRWLGALAMEMEIILAARIYFSSLDGIEPSFSDYAIGVLGLVLIVAFILVYTAKRQKKRTEWDDYKDPIYNKQALVVAFLRFCFFVFAYIAVLTFFAGYCPTWGDCVTATQTFDYWTVFAPAAIGLAAGLWWTYKKYDIESLEEEFGEIEG